MKHFFYKVLPPILWAGLIFFFSNQPNLSSGLGNWDFVLRKIAHMVEFGVLFWLVYRALKYDKKLVTYAILLAILYAVLDEFHQLFILGRMGSSMDVLIDGVGIFVSYLIVRRVKNE
ncbi:MAG: VanZ family protein [bacterium]